jgi:orotate phosphoribosyltransferase
MQPTNPIAPVLLDANAVLLRPDEPFTFASGLRSPIYCDNRLLIGNIAARRAVTAGFASRCAGAEVIAGTATAGIPWAAWVAEELELPMAYVRAAAKGHGRGRQIEGASIRERRVVLLEDTISTGESALAAAEVLRADGCELLGCAGIFTWGWKETSAAFAAANLPLSVLVTLAELLDAATAKHMLTPEQRMLVEAWAADPKGWSGKIGDRRLPIDD